VAIEFVDDLLLAQPELALVARCDMMAHRRIRPALGHGLAFGIEDTLVGCVDDERWVAA
jgi:hypothetical protein